MNQYGRGGPHSGTSGYRAQRDQVGRYGSPNDTIAQHWPDYLKGGYFDTGGCLKVEYVSRERVEPLAQKMSSLTIHQIRRYFSHCRAIETRLRSVGAAWESLWPEVKRLDVAAADGAAKQPPKIPPLFHDFIRRNVDKIKTKDDFLKGFLPHFEALVGFGQAYFRKDRS
jgi:CRISPR type III-A-associated protein Csm2